MRCGVVAHQRPAPLLIHHALDPFPAPYDPAGDMVEDHFANLDNPVDLRHALGTDERAGIGRLPAALRVEEGLVKDCICVKEVQHNRLELDIRRLLVIEFPGRGKGPQPVRILRGLVLLGLLLRFGVHVGHHGIEVIRQVNDRSLLCCDLLDHFRLDAVGIIERHDLGKRDTLAFRLVGLCNLLDDPGAAFER